MKNKKYIYVCVDDKIFNRFFNIFILKKTFTKIKLKYYGYNLIIGKHVCIKIKFFHFFYLKKTFQFLNIK